MIADISSGVFDRLKTWWEFEPQEKPLVLLSVTKNQPVYPNDLKEFYENTENAIKRQLDKVDNTVYYGEAVPNHYIDFGSSAMAGMLGAQMRYISHDTIWPSPVCKELDEICGIAMDKNNFFYKMVYGLLESSVKNAYDKYFVGTYAFGGLCDTIGSLYGEQKLLTDLYDKPDVAKRAIKKIKDIWVYEFENVHEKIKRSGNNGNIGWAGVWAPGSTFPVQEDMSYMISADMFIEFCLGPLSDLFEIIDYPMYHLDGSGAIRHLDALLSLSRLKVIQWIPGAGHEQLSGWYPLIKKILANKKSVQVFAQADEIAPAVRELGTRGVLFTVSDPGLEALNLLSSQGLINL